jgi:Flp pilus assembly protein TadG
MRCRHLHHPRAWLARFMNARGAAVAIETAIVVPLLCFAIVILADTVRFIRTTARMERVAGITADLIARNDKIVDRVNFNTPTLNNELGMFFLTANKAAAPDDLAGQGQVIVTSVTPTSTGRTLNWQRTGPYGISQSSRVGSLPPLPTSGAYIVAEVFFRFQSTVLESLGLLSSTNALIYRRAVFRPRLAALETLQAPP